MKLVSISVLVISIGIVSFLLISSTLPLNGLFGQIFEKEPIKAAASLPIGFSESLVTAGLASPTAMEFAPDGRLFVAQQAGQLRIIKNGTLLSTPFINLTVDANGERGLLGIAFDPQFNSNHFIYLYYTTPSPSVHNRVSRFTANGDVVVPGSELILLELDNLSGATNHNGGSIHFGMDGKLYITVGDNANASNAQGVGNLLGKVLRLNPDGTIPSDNPTTFTASNGSALTPTGKNRAIYAIGFRNPFTSGIQPATGRIFINDVGDFGTPRREEINDLLKGQNYGWSTCQGGLLNNTNNPCPAPPHTNPLFSYPPAGDGNCAITGGTFYNPATVQFPTQYLGRYFFADYCGGWIKQFNPATGTVSDFATGGIAWPVDLKVGPDGALYYLARGNSTPEGVVYKITSNGATPPPSPTPPAGSQSINFDDRNADTVLNGEYPQGMINWGNNAWIVSGPYSVFNTNSFSYNGGGINSGTFNFVSPRRVISIQAANGGTVASTVTIGCPGNTAVSQNVPLNQLTTITTNWINNCTGTVSLTSTNGWNTNFDNLIVGTGTSTPAPSPSATPAAPTANISTPATGTTYAAGNTISYSGSGTDAVDGNLPAGRFSWTVVFHHDTHTHPFLGPINGVTGGSFQIPTQGETASNVFYRIHLTVTNSQGLTDEVVRDVIPRKANITLQSVPAGLQLTLDGISHVAPYTENNVVGFQRDLGLTSPQTLNGKAYRFVSWSDSGGQNHQVSVPASSITYTATFGIPGDADDDGDVDIFDYNQVITDFAKTGQGILGDLDKDGDVDIFDYNIVVENFGRTD